jgi:hypothetical protein
MKTKTRVVVGAVALGGSSLTAVLVLATAAFAQTLVQNFQCKSPPQGDTIYCTMPQVNPCGVVPQNCFAWGRWFEEQNLGCVNDPGQTVASGSNGNANVDWTGCATGYVPSSSCQMSEQVCGDVDTYWGANCQQNTFCGNYSMYACQGVTPVNCPGGQ